MNKLMVSIGMIFSQTATKNPLSILTHCVFVALLTTLTQHSLASELSLNGLAAYEKLRKEYYIGALYLESQDADSMNFAGKKRMEMLISTAKWTPRRFSRDWNQAIFLNNDQALLEKFPDQIQAFTNLPKGNLTSGDFITVDMDPEQGTTVYVNGYRAFSVANREFFDVLLNVWVGKRPPSSDFKNHILTLSTDQPGTELLARFQSIAPTELRNKEIASWFKPKPSAKKKARGAQTKVVAPTQQLAKVEPLKPTTAEPLKTTIVAAKPPREAVALLAIAGQKPTLDAAILNSHIKAQLEIESASETAKSDAMLIQENLKAAYASNLLKLTYLNTVYPKKAMMRKQRGKVAVKVKINRKGDVVSVEEELSSKYKRLNKAALSAVKKAAPYPAPPRELLGEHFEFTLPFNFKL